jgi:hypothetical protein
MPFCEHCGAKVLGDACDKCSAAQDDSSVPPQPINGPNQVSITPASAPANPSESPVKSKALLSQFQKNVVFIAVTVFILVAAGMLVNNTIHVRARHLEEQKVEWRKANIKILKDLSDIGALSTEEQTRVDNAGDDIERLQQVLLDIHQERITIWLSHLEDVVERKRHLQTLNYTNVVAFGQASEYADAAHNIARQEAKAKENLAGYELAIKNIRQWKPVSFEDFRAGRLIDPGSSGPPKSAEQ